ncbi:Bsp6I family type II restriction endonuclease [Alkalibacillus haloalkaliphilus]|uniref:Bsp6I family type II restriction endonuclease n=1 Tax=Alkalibacillus haloalkaliphilus TaxID=94136 RepID=UPI002935D386|nr:Bsp6I family type II restriction endonuclease [Alkalibacillus haloalkaliphilus]MDV2581579.1 Bsp6I family type II restriction endonuclease [Alkalibacillus haloalkaliphilus]
MVIDKSRFKDAVRAYWLWKELNSIIKNSHNRGINFPETISETMFCYALGFELNRGTGGDARDPKTDSIIEVKASSNWDRDTSSFSPSEEFDNLYFVRLDQRNDIISFYDLNLNSNQLKGIKVSQKQTVEDQQKQGRRPRFGVIKKVIEPSNLKPVCSIDIRKEKII